MKSNAGNADPVRSPDPAFTPFVTASPEQIRYAQELLRRIERRYLGDRPDRVDEHSSATAD